MYNNGFELSEHIETLFKVEPPLTPIENGHGFIGVLLRDKNEDKIQCHICGEWRKLLGVHLVQAHGMNSKKYRKKFGLPLAFPLCSVGFSKAKSGVARRPENLVRLAAVRDPAKIMRKSQKTRKRFMKYATCNASHQNKHGLCEDQMLRRYLIVADIVEKEPSNRDLVKYDQALFSAIRRRYGNKINKFREKHGFQTRAKAKIQSEDSIIAALRKKHDQIKRIPKPTDFRKGSPTIETIRHHFGSWHRALESAGFHAVL